MTEPEQRSADDPVAAATDDVVGGGADVDDRAEGPIGHQDAATDDTEHPSTAQAPPSQESVEDLIAALERTLRERDDYLAAVRRTQADFENYRKRVMKQQAEDMARAAGSLVEKLLPVLDACDGAVRHGATEVEPIFASLLGTLEKDGLERIDPLGQEFDPNVHDAVMHEPAEDGETITVVSDVMRPGYSWKGRVVRPAMVKVRG